MNDALGVAVFQSQHSLCHVQLSHVFIEGVKIAQQAASKKMCAF
jgi:hypothetical protein